jgi:hypothetical protein
MIYEAKRKAHPEALWIANSHKEVAIVNREDFDEKVQADITHVRIVVQYETGTSTKPNPNQEDIIEKNHNTSL